MGKSITPKYQIRIQEFNLGTRQYETRTMAWDAKRDGKPTDAKVEAWAKAYIASLKMGGCNEHISLGLGYIPVPNRVQVVTNDRYKVLVAGWNAPAFMII